MGMVQLVRLQMVRERCVEFDGKRITDPAAAARLVRRILDDTDREQFVVLAVNTKNHLVGANIASVGSLNASVVHPREIFKFAYLANAAAVIIAHNHPSGDPEPSPEDREVTRRLIGAGRVLGIDVLDHVILGDPDYRDYWSFREQTPSAFDKPA